MKTLTKTKDPIGTEKQLQNIPIEIGMLFTKSNEIYRVIGQDLSMSYAYFCTVKKAPIFMYLPYTEFLNGIVSQDIIKIEEVIPHPNNDFLTKDELDSILKKENAMFQVIDRYRPSFIGLKSKQDKHFLMALAEECEMSYDSFRRLINKYIQSGFHIHSLYPKNSKAFGHKRLSYHYQSKPGRKKYGSDFAGIVITNEIKEIFDRYIQVYLSSNHLTIRNVYNQMNADCFREEIPNHTINVLKPIYERPTFSQFKYYLYSSTSQKERKVSRQGIRKFRNDERKLVSDTLVNVLGPADRVEIDAWECPIAVVDGLERSKVLGKPVLYAMVDCATKMVLAASLSFENNSFIGLTSLFLNMTLDKREDEIGTNEILSSYNICNVPKILPRSVISDRGSDFISKNFELVLERLHINHNITPAATGSYKGNVEQLFNQLNIAMKPYLLNHGYITKDYDDNPYKNATLTIGGLARIIHSTIVKRNIGLFENFKPTKDMIDKNIYLSPVSLWDYYIKETLNEPRRIHDSVQYAYNLMIDEKASVGRQGIKFKGLFFDCNDDSVLQDQIFHSKGATLSIRYDPRDTSSIFYQRGDKIFEAKLNQNLLSNSSFSGLSWYEYERYRKEMRIIKNNNININDNLNVLYGMSVKQVIDSEITEKNNQNEIKNIRENRKQAKEKLTNSTAIKYKIDINTNHDESRNEESIETQEGILKNEGNLDPFLESLKNLE